MNEQETIFFDAFGEIHNRTVKMDHDVEVRLNATKEWLRGILNKMNIWSNLKLNQLNKTMNERKNILEKFRASYAQTAVRNYNFLLGISNSKVIKQVHNISVYFVLF